MVGSLVSFLTQSFEMKAQGKGVWEGRGEGVGVGLGWGSLLLGAPHQPGALMPIRSQS